MGIFNLFNKKKESNTPANQFFDAVVTGIEKLTENAVAVTLAPALTDADFSFEAGQYLNVEIQVDGITERRSYSIASSPKRGKLKIGVKALKGGKVSNYINTRLKEGDKVRISKPQGDFRYHDPKTGGFSVGIAVGSGITPILSMMYAAKENKHPFKLLFGNRNEHQIMFRYEINDLSQSGNIEVHHFLSAGNLEGSIKGKMEGEVLRSFLKEKPEMMKADAFYLCGPETMIAEVMGILKEMGVNGSSIRYELFTTPVLLKPSEPSVSGNGSQVNNAEVEVNLGTESIHFQLSTQDQSILDVLLKKGYEAPYMCRSGFCATCKAKIIRGTVKMDNNYSVPRNEVEQGYILTCQSHPTSEVLKITYDIPNKPIN